MLEAVSAYAGHPDDLTLTESMTRLGRALPLGYLAMLIGLSAQLVRSFVHSLENAGADTRITLVDALGRVVRRDKGTRITFDTRDEGVEMADWLRERYPEEMTIVIQHRFWDLKVEDDAFSVGLSFGGVPSTLRVPFAAVTDFVDPAVDFSLKFQSNANEVLPEEHDEAENDEPLDPVPDDGSNVVSVDFTRKK